MTKPLLFFCILLIILFSFPGFGVAQREFSAKISLPDDSEFPTIEFFLDVHDQNGGFVHNLSENQIKILENDVALTAAEITETKPGFQFVVAINPGPSFAIRNSQAISRYDLISQSLKDWAKSRIGSDIDDLSLIINNGPEVSHVKEPDQWLQTLENAEVDSRNAIPNLDGLFRAVTIVNDATPRPGMERSILFITPPIESKLIEPLDNLIAQVSQQNISIHIWMISSAGSFQTAGVEKLMDLANLTGGTFFAFSGEEEIPTPESFLKELRTIYKVNYNSVISTGGTHQIKVQIDTDEGVVETNTLEFEINLQPPLPAFISPPIRIIRKPSDFQQNIEKKSDDSSSYQPSEQMIQVIFDFPDGRKREIVSSAFLVNGEVLIENKKQPFDTFLWNISEITSAGTYTLQVQATDSFNITGSSVEIPVIVGVEEVTQDPWRMIRENTTILISLAVVISGAILLLVLILGGQLRPRAIRISQRRTKKIDPVTQPVLINDENEKRTSPGWKDKLQWPQRQQAQKALAYLFPLTENSQTGYTTPFPIYTNEILIGTDPEKVALLLQDNSLEKIHARLIRKEEGSFRIVDEGSVAGTWLNYSPVSVNGADLEHGDIIHIGRVGFRFTIRQPKLIRRPVVTNLPDKEQGIPVNEVETPPTKPDLSDQ